MKKIQFVDLFSQYQELKPRMDAAIQSIIQNSSFIRGASVENFEHAFSKIIGTDHCISCANGTDSLYVALKSLNVKPGDEVIVPAMSWISTSGVVSQTGADVVFVDINLQDYTLDSSDLTRKITNKTVGIIPVHLYGHPADMDYICKIAKESGLWIIEDCAQAHLARYNDRKVGTFSDFASFSFYPGKNLGAMGDAGALLTNNAHLAEYAAMFARHGGLQKGQHLIEGINSRMDGIQAAILNVKLNEIEKWHAARQKIANRYLDELSHLDFLVLPQVKSGCEHAWHLFSVRSRHRDKIREYLSKHSIPTSVNYPVSLPFLPAYARLNHKVQDFSQSYELQNTVFSLPVHPHLSDEQQSYIIETLTKFDE